MKITRILQPLTIILLAFTINGCTPAQLAQIQKSINKKNAQQHPGQQPGAGQQQQTAARKNQVTYPPNGDRIKVTTYTPAPGLTVNYNPYGTRYKDFVFQNFDVKTEYFQRNVTNFNGTNKNLIVDIFTPQGDNVKNRPCIVYIFGGGFYMKVDDGIQEMCKGMALKGYVVACIDYRIGFKNSNMSALCVGDYYADGGMYEAEMRATQDARAAIRYVKGNAQRLGVDPNMIIVGGQSAGAITAIDALLYTDADVKPNVLQKLGGSLDNEGDYKVMDNDVAGVFQLSGAVLNESILRPTKTPIYMLFGTCDEILHLDKGYCYHCDGKSTSVAYTWGGRYIYNALKATSPIRLDMVCKGGHGPGGWGYNNMVDWVTTFTYSIVTNTFKTTEGTVYPDKPVCANSPVCQ